jgi:hypothetical protein
MNVPRRPFNRHISRLSVIPVTFPVFNGLPHQTHPRLHIQYSLIAFPVSEYESDFEIHCLLNIYLPEDDRANALEKNILENFGGLTEITNLNWRIDFAEEELAAARQKNDESYAGQNEEFRILLEKYSCEQTALNSMDMKESTSPQDKRKFLQQKEYLWKLRNALNALLLPQSASLPHPIKKNDKAEGSEALSIEELEERLAAEKTALQNALQELRRNKSVVASMLNDYLLGLLNCMPGTSTRQKLARIFMHQQLIIAEIESGFGKDPHVQMDGRGIPADASGIPFSVDLRVLSVAYAERTEIYYGGYFAFVPPNQPYADGLQYGLLGVLRKKHAELVAIPIPTIETILSNEREYRILVKHAIAALYAQAPSTGAAQEQEKPDNDAEQSDHPRHSSNEEPHRIPQESFPHFPFDENK